MLEVKGITTKYGEITGVRDVSLTVGAGELVCVLGPNGAGKTTTLNTIVGLLQPTAGSVWFDGQDITGREPDELLKMGLVLVPEHRRIFTDLTVVENLMVGGTTLSPQERRSKVEEMCDLFEILERKRATKAGYLSGGEAQILAVARALMTSPRLLLIDEPSLGLAPVLVDMIFDLLQSLKEKDQAMLVVEQNAQRALQITDRAYILRSGALVDQGTGEELMGRPDLFDSYIGL